MFFKIILNKIKEGEKDVKQIISKLSELRYSIATDKPLIKISESLDSYVWNNELNIYSKEVFF